MDKIKAIIRKSKYYRIEQFGFVFMILAFMLCLTMAMGFVHNYNADKNLLTDRAIYTKAFETSRTNISGEVQDIFVSKDRTRAFLLMKFDDVDAVSTNAKNYQAFLTATNKNMGDEDLLGHPSGGFYVFGSSGYFGMYLVDEEGFKPQILNLTVRANSELVPVENINSEIKDESFLENDQFRVYFNPGAKKAKVSRVLSSEDFDVFDLYEEVAVRDREKEARGEVNKQLDVMRTALNAANEYKTRLETISVDGKSVAPAEPPESIRGDKVSIIDNKTDKEVTAPSDKTHLEFKTVYVMPGGFDFDWYHGSIRDGYMDRLRQPGETYSEFLIRKGKEVQTESLGLNDIHWYFTDGTPIETENLEDQDIGNLATVNKTIQLLLDKWADYANEKTVYQTRTLRKLIDLEYEARNVEENYTTNTSDKVLICY